MIGHVESGHEVKGRVVAVRSSDTAQATQLLIDTGNKLTTTLGGVFQSDNGPVMIRSGYGCIPYSVVTSIEEQSGQ